jgi:hypothetical protein
MDPRYSARQSQYNGNDWLSKLNQIKEARSEYNKIERILTPYERQTIFGNIKADAEANYSRVYNGVKARLDAAVGNYKAAAAKRAAAIAKEINSWDAGKLNDELQAFSTRVNMEVSKKDAQGIYSGQPAAARIEALYQEALASGDRYKMRAAAEVLRAADVEKLPSEQQMQVQLLARAASDNLEALRNTDDIRNAIDQENAAIKQMQDEQRFVREAAEVMFDEGGQIFGRDVSSFGKLASTIKFEREAGNVKIKILDINDPEITGIDLSNLKEQEGE